MKNIFVPSKNRLNNATFLNLAYQYNIKLNVVVENEEYIDYKNKYPSFNFLKLPKSNQGITYVRNYIKNYTIEKGIKYFWQIDDDITNFYNRNGTKLIKSNFDVLTNAEELFLKNDIALGGLEYRQFAWSATKNLILNSFCDSCVWFDNTKVKDIAYRHYVEGKEDRDFAMQVIKNNHKTARSTLHAFSAPPNGSNKGGLKEIFYDVGKETICVNRMIELWGSNICKPIIKENGRHDIKIMWNEINNNQLSLF